MIIMMGVVISLAIFLIMFWLFSNTATAKQQKFAGDKQIVAEHSQSTFSISSKDIEVIAGDDVMDTQLNLAHAYLETGRMNLAKSILNHVVQHGAEAQREEAQQLLNHIDSITPYQRFPL